MTNGDVEVRMIGDMGFAPSKPVSSSARVVRVLTGAARACIHGCVHIYTCASFMKDTDRSVLYVTCHIREIWYLT